MLLCKTFVVFVSLCLIHKCVSKPATGNELVTEGRGVMSSIWGWITYPFTWWRTETIEQPVTEQLVGSTTNAPNDIVDIRSHNVTIWCNDQTCTTMKCDATQCKNITCSLYETDFRGECREYNILTHPKEDTVENTSETVSYVYVSITPTASSNTTFNIKNTSETASNVYGLSQPTPTPTSIIKNTSDKNERIPTVEGPPLELEAVLSSTVNKLTEGEHADGKEN